MSIVRDVAAVLVTVSAAASAMPAAAAESYDNCSRFVDALPAVLEQQGVWCLRGDLSTSAAGSGYVAIDIRANNVTLECNGFKVGGLAGGVDTLAVGVGSSTSRLNTTIRGCSIRGFARGISLEFNCGGHLVENNRLDNNRVVGILVSGGGSTIRGNRVVTTGGSAIAAPSVGIAAGYDVDVIDNLVSGVAPKAGSGRDGIGILAQSNDLGTFSGNRVRAVDGDGAGVGIGIRVQGASHAIIAGNEITAGAAVSDQAVTCDSAQPSARDNTISGYAAGLTGCSDDGGNIVK